MLYRKHNIPKYFYISIHGVRSGLKSNSKTIITFDELLFSSMEKKQNCLHFWWSMWLYNKILKKKVVNYFSR